MKRLMPLLLALVLVRCYGIGQWMMKQSNSYGHFSHMKKEQI